MTMARLHKCSLAIALNTKALNTKHAIKNLYIRIFK